MAFSSIAVSLSSASFLGGLGFVGDGAQSGGLGGLLSVGGANLRAGVERRDPGFVPVDSGVDLLKGQKCVEIFE